MGAEHEADEVASLADETKIGGVTYFIGFYPYFRALASNDLNSPNPKC